jgi:mercuric ion transport protein
MKIELIYDADCPNVTQARALLIKAFTRTGISAHWLEWERASPESPEYARTFGSPTILIDGKDVAETGAVSGSGACRVYSDSAGRLSGIPPLDTVSSALLAKTAPLTPSTPGRWRALAAASPALGVALLPKLVCPLCFPAYAAILSALGIEFLDYTPYLLPLTAFFLAVALGVLALQTRRTGNVTALLLGLVSAMIVLLGKFYFEHDWLMTSGIVLLIVAILLGNRNPTSTTPTCPACVSGGSDQSIKAH